MKKSENGFEWSFAVEHYNGSITAEEFAALHNVLAVNDNADDSYQFIGSEENVKKAFESYHSEEG